MRALKAAISAVSTAPLSASVNWSSSRRDAFPSS